MNKTELSIKQKNADKDLNIIIFATLIPLVIYVLFGNKMMYFAKSVNINIWFRFIPVMLMQFGLAGLGSLMVILYRKEKLSDYGLVKANFIKTVLLSVLVCIPAFIFKAVNNEITLYLPFKGCLHTKEFLALNFPGNILGYLLTAVTWGFFEGFNYVVISKKINDRYLSKNKWLNNGAVACAAMCILIHGMIGLDLYTVFEAVSTFIIIYGMLLIKEKTNNAWGCILIFLLFWNAV